MTTLFRLSGHASILLAFLIGALLNPRTTWAGQWIEKAIEFQGRERTFRIYRPSLLPFHPAAVFVFHGTSNPGHGAENIISITHFDRAAERNHFVVIFPEAVQGNWNDGRRNEDSAAYREGVNDIGFVDRILEYLKATLRIDARKIYATGYSNGAIFVHYLAAERSAEIAAISPVCGTMARHSFQTFRPSHPVSVLEIHGTSDPVVPYTGGAIAHEKGHVLSVDQCISIWAENDRCQRIPERISISGSDKKDGCTPELFAWGRGKEKSVVELCRIVGGGHTWPGGNQFFSSIVLGNISRDFDGAELIWRFFHRHPKVKAPDRLGLPENDVLKRS